VITEYLLLTVFEVHYSTQSLMYVQLFLQDIQLLLMHIIYI
jgi:hypothetical protein